MPVKRENPDDTATESLRRERGDTPSDPRDHLTNARVGPSSIGVVGQSPTPEPEEERAERQAPPAPEEET